MKTGLFAVALAICLLAGAMSGAALAGDARVAGWGYSSSGSHMGSMSTSDEAAFPVVEYGGVQYRIGLDTAS